MPLALPQARKLTELVDIKNAVGLIIGYIVSIAGLGRRNLGVFFEKNNCSARIIMFQRFRIRTERRITDANRSQRFAYDVSCKRFTK